MKEIAAIFRHLGKLCRADALKWESFLCGAGFCGATEVFNFSDGATLSIITKHDDSGKDVATVCVCTPYSKDVPVLYARADCGRLRTEVSIEMFDTCSCKAANMPNLDAVTRRYGCLLNSRNSLFPACAEKMSCSASKVSFFRTGRTALLEYLKDFISCYADILSKRPSFCLPENGDNTIVNRQQNLVDELFFPGNSSSAAKLFKGLDIPDYEDFVDFIHFCAIPHPKIDKTLLI